MPYPYPARTRMIRRECRSGQIPYACSSGTVTAALSLPASSFTVGITVEAIANAAPIVIKAAPYVDLAQTLTNGNFKFLKTGTTTVTTNITVALTTTRLGWSGVLIPAGDQYGAAAPVITVHGTELTITSTSSVGDAIISFSAVEN